MPITLASTALSLESQAADWDEAVDGGTFTLAGTSYNAAIVRSGVRKAFDDHGHGQQVETLRIDVRKDVLATRPADSAIITCGGVEWFLDPDAAQVDAGLTWIMRYKRVV